MIHRLLFILTFLLTPKAPAAVDLHMHLTMEITMGSLYSGNLLGTVKGTDENSRLKSRVDYETLEASGLKLVVAALVASPIRGVPEEQIERQIELLKKFCEKHANWKIVSSPKEARDEIKKGNKVFVLSLEGAWLLNDQKRFREFVDKHSIKIIAPFHFTDLHGKLGEAAHQKGLVGWIQKIIRFFKSDEPPITPIGEELLRAMFELGIWVDLSHASDQAVERFMKIRPTGYPLLITHTILAKYYGTERGISGALIDRLKTENGAVGLLPSTEMLVGTPAAQDGCAKDNPYLVQWNELVSAIGKKKVYLGSDFNSPIPTMPATPPNPRCPDPLLKNGLITAKDLKQLVSLQDDQAVSNFLGTWEQVRP